MKFHLNSMNDRRLEAALQTKKQADMMWNRVFNDKALDWIPFAMQLCQNADGKLLEIEAQIRARKIQIEIMNDLISSYEKDQLLT